MGSSEIVIVHEDVAYAGALAGALAARRLSRHIEVFEPGDSRLAAYMGKALGESEGPDLQFTGKSQGTRFPQPSAQSADGKGVGAALVICSSALAAQFENAVVLVDAPVPDDRLAEKTHRAGGSPSPTVGPFERTSLQARGSQPAAPCTERNASGSVGQIFRIQPIDKLLAEIAGLLPEAGPYALPYMGRPGEATFIGVTAAAGGLGVSSAALCLGRILSELYELSTLYISFDRLEKHIAKGGPAGGEPSRASGSLESLIYGIITGKRLSALDMAGYEHVDEAGLVRFVPAELQNPLAAAAVDEAAAVLSKLSAMGRYERIILDVPINHKGWRELMSMCEKQIVLYGYNRELSPMGDTVFDILDGLYTKSAAVDAPSLYKLKTLYDEHSFTYEDGALDVDIHGQLGAEVRALAEELEG